MNYNNTKQIHVLDQIIVFTFNLIVPDKIPVLTGNDSNSTWKIPSQICHLLENDRHLHWLLRIRMGYHTKIRLPPFSQLRQMQDHIDTYLEHIINILTNYSF